jgi:hypothetical protein
MSDQTSPIQPNSVEFFSDALAAPGQVAEVNPDGGLTVYLGSKSPSKDKESNWLAAPDGEFSIWIRAYWADRTILDGTWEPPAVTLEQSMGGRARQ